MLGRRLFPLVSLAIVIALASCEGEQGPTGPAGPPGPSVIISFGEISGYSSTAESSWPDDVMVAVTPVAVGVWDVTLTGTFPAEEGNLLVSVSDSNMGRTITGRITEWTTDMITFRVGIYNAVEAEFTPGDFSFVILDAGV